MKNKINGKNPIHLIDDEMSKHIYEKFDFDRLKRDLDKQKSEKKFLIIVGK